MYGVVLRKKMDADMRIILYVFADVLFVLTAVFPVVTVCCIRSYPKHRALTLLLVKELVLKSRIEDDGSSAAADNAIERNRKRRRRLRQHYERTRQQR